MRIEMDAPEGKVTPNLVAFLRMKQTRIMLIDSTPTTARLYTVEGLHEMPGLLELLTKTRP